MTTKPRPPEPTAEEYRALAAFRYEIRRFLSYSEEAARSAGLSPQQHQLLLAVKGLPAGLRPTIRVVAERLRLRHNSTVELVDRLEALGFLRRGAGADAREVLLEVTLRGTRVLGRLSLAHRDELRTLLPATVAALNALDARGTGAARRSASSAKGVARVSR
jgi:DNA-binding MarR family transcriptional regulator